MPYQTYLKQVVFRQALADIEQATAVLAPEAGSSARGGLWPAIAVAHELTRRPGTLHCLARVSHEAQRPAPASAATPTSR